MKPHVFVKTAQVAAFLAVAFLVFRIVAPWLVNLHDTPALILAIALIVAFIFALAWFVWDLIIIVVRGGRDHA